MTVKQSCMGQMQNSSHGYNNNKNKQIGEEKKEKRKNWAGALLTGQHDL